MSLIAPPNARRRLMTEITRYIFRQLVAGTVLVSVALCCIVWLTQSLRYLQLVVNRGLPLSAWIKLTLLLMPNLLAVLIPPSLFFVVLFIYNKLALDRELVVAQAAGISRLSLTIPTLWAAASAAAVCMSLTLLIVPETQRAFREILWTMRNDVSQMLLREGAFNQIAPGLTMYVRARTGEGELHGILVHDARDPTAVITLLAERGILASGTDGPHVRLINGTRQQINGDGQGLTMLYFESYTVNFGNLNSPTGDRLEDFRERNIIDLFSLGAADGFTAGEVARMRAEGHQRIITPLTTFAYTLTALVFLLTGGFDRRGQLLRICCAIGALVGLETAGLSAADLAGRAPQFVALMYAVGLLPTALTLYIIASPVDWGPVWRRLSPAAST